MSEETQVVEEKKAEVKEKKEVKPVSQKLESVLKTIEELTVIELADLVKALEDRFGVSAAAVTYAGPVGGGGAAAGGAEAVEEKDSFAVVLTSAGDKKIQVIKELRTLTNLGLKEAKDLVDAAPKTIQEAASKEEAEKIKKTLEAVGAKVELK